MSDPEAKTKDLKKKKNDAKKVLDDIPCCQSCAANDLWATCPGRRTRTFPATTRKGTERPHMRHPRTHQGKDAQPLQSVSKNPRKKVDKTVDAFTPSHDSPPHGGQIDYPLATTYLLKHTNTLPGRPNCAPDHS